MCSAEPGRERIIEAAMSLFAAHGFDATGVRAIAEAAGVSAPLINHHFGSKVGLRSAVDDHAVDSIRRIFADLESAEPSQFTAELLSRLEGEATTLAYVRRELQEGGPSGAALVDGLVDATVGAMEDLEGQGLARPSSDPLARALVLLTLDLGSLVLEPHLARHLDEPIWTAAPSRRWFDAVVEVLSGGVLFPPSDDDPPTHPRS